MALVAPPSGTPTAVTAKVVTLCVLDVGGVLPVEPPPEFPPVLPVVVVLVLPPVVLPPPVLELVLPPVELFEPPGAEAGAKKPTGGRLEIPPPPPNEMPGPTPLNPPRNWGKCGSSSDGLMVKVGAAAGPSIG